MFCLSRAEGASGYAIAAPFEALIYDAALCCLSCCAARHAVLCRGIDAAHNSITPREDAAARREVLPLPPCRRTPMREARMLFYSPPPLRCLRFFAMHDGHHDDAAAYA